MATERKDIRDASGRLLGREERTDDGRTTLRDAGGRLLGRYDERTNTVRDVSGALVGRGRTLLGGLLGCRSK